VLCKVNQYSGETGLYIDLFYNELWGNHSLADSCLYLLPGLPAEAAVELHAKAILDTISDKFNWKPMQF
jgi:hypothetical protein